MYDPNEELKTVREENAKLKMALLLAMITDVLSDYKDKKLGELTVGDLGKITIKLMENCKELV